MFEKMGVNLVVLRRTPVPPGIPSPRSAPRWRVLFVITYKYWSQDANTQKKLSNKTQIALKTYSNV